MSPAPDVAPLLCPCEDHLVQYFVKDGGPEGKDDAVCLACQRPIGALRASTPFFVKLKISGVILEMLEEQQRGTLCGDYVDKQVARVFAWWDHCKPPQYAHRAPPWRFLREQVHSEGSV